MKKEYDDKKETNTFDWIKQDDSNDEDDLMNLDF